MKAAARQRPSAWFPEGRDPWRNLYGPEVVREIGKVVGMTADKDLDRLGVWLCRVAELYLVVGDEVGLELKSGARAKWIDAHLLKPARTLIDALDRANSRFFTEYPGAKVQWIDRALIPPPKEWLDSFEERGGKFVRPKKSLRELGHVSSYRKLWLVELQRLIQWAEAKKKEFINPPKPRKKPATQFRADLVYDLLLLYAHLFPSRKRSRTSHNRSPQKTRSAKERSMIQNEFVEFIRAAAAPVLGNYQNLDRQIQEALERHKAERTELWMRFHLFI